MAVIAQMVLSLALSAAPASSDGSVSSQNLDEYSQSARTNINACGPLAVWYSLSRLGHDVPLDDVRAKVQVRDDGISGEELMRLCNEMGLPAHAVYSEDKDLARLPVPAILVVEDTHCVVFDGFDEETGVPRIFEPTTMQVGPEPAENLARHWTGHAVVFGPPAMPARTFAGLAVLATLSVVGLVTVGSALWRMRRLTSRELPVMARSR